MAQCPERCKVCAQPAMLDTVPPQKPDDPEVIRITGCACGAFTADRDWWYMEADTERTAAPAERFAQLSSVLLARHKAGEPAHLGRGTWSELAAPAPPKPEKPAKAPKATKRTKSR
jgi:hypothetical protein